MEQQKRPKCVIITVTFRKWRHVLHSRHSHRYTYSEYVHLCRWCSPHRPRPHFHGRWGDWHCSGSMSGCWNTRKIRFIFSARAPPGRWIFDKNALRCFEQTESKTSRPQISTYIVNDWCETESAYFAEIVQNFKKCVAKLRFGWKKISKEKNALRCNELRGIG